MKQRVYTGAAVRAFPLSMAEAGRCVRIQRILGGHGLQRRLSDMGLVPGMEIEVISTDRGGPLVVRILESRFMIGRGMAHHIEVS
jgi:ferrous iron transport protein A